MRIECPCGFQGSVREQETPLGVYGRCFGCDTLYDRKGNIMAGVPDFKDYKEMQAFLDKMTEGKAPKSSTGKPKRTRKRKPAEKDSSGELITEKPKVPIFKTIHFYLRPGDTWDQLLKDGREEVNYAGPGTVVCCHMHAHGSECKDSCRSMT